MSNRPHQRPNGAVNQGIPIEVSPGPVPVQILVQQCETTAGPAVVITSLTATGQHVIFLPVDVAKKVAQDILNRATPVTVTGLVPREWS